MLLFALAACPSVPPGTTDVDDPASTADVVWYGDVEPIVSGSCTGCHVDGGIGGFALDSYEAAKPMAAAIASSVAARKMPPWKADAGCDTYREDISLTDEQIARLQAWSDEGAAEGDPADSARIEPASPSLSRVDTTLTLPVPYTPDVAPDDYRCFLVDWPVDHDTYVTGTKVNPGATSIVHHLVAYIAETPEQVAEYEALDAAEEGPGWTCFGGPGASRQQDASWLGAWAPGATNGDFPDGTGIPMKPGYKVVLQMHYNTSSAPAEPDQTTMDIRFDDEVDAPAYIQPWADPRWLDGSGMEIPAQTNGTEHSFSYTFSRGGFLLHTASLHMHQLGQTSKLSVTHDDGSEDCLLSISDWDFNWQRTYVFDEAKTIQNGDTLTVSCTWDNPTDNDVNWGEGTGDEMCLSTMLFSY